MSDPITLPLYQPLARMQSIMLKEAFDQIASQVCYRNSIPDLHAYAVETDVDEQFARYNPRAVEWALRLLGHFPEEQIAWLDEHGGKYVASATYEERVTDTLDPAAAGAFGTAYTVPVVAYEHTIFLTFEDRDAGLLYKLTFGGA